MIPRGSAPAAFTDAEIAHLQSLLDALPPPLQPLDVSALDGFLCGVLLQPGHIAADRWLPLVLDIEGRATYAASDELLALLLRRHAALDRAIGTRQWFDPWIYNLEDDAVPSDSMLPWVAGFAAAQDAFGDLTALDDPALVEPLALLYMHFDAEDLEGSDALGLVIEALEPPTDLAEAIEDAVRAVMLIADVTRPNRKPRPPRAPRR